MTQPAAPPENASRSSAKPPDLILGVALDWIEQHCVIPDGFRKGRRLALYDWQVKYLGGFYTIRGSASWVPSDPVLAPAFTYRRGLIVGPQKLGKDPMVAAQVCLEAVGPALFGGWAGKDDGYVCAEHGCGCGWEAAYEPGEPMGMSWPTPLIQITAVSEEATENTYDALRPMIEDGPLADIIPKTGEEFIRLPNGGRIDTVTSSAQSRLGQRVTHVVHGEAGLYTRSNGMQKVAETQYRGLAGMGGRASLLTNAWDPAEHSVAQRHFDAAEPDVLIQFAQPPSGLRFTVREDRRRVLRHVYPPETWRENGGHLDLDAIEAEAADLVKHDPAQAARFFGNQLVTGSGKAFEHDVWVSRISDHTVPGRALITAGFDGSKTGDHTALIGCEISTGHLWPIGIWDPAEHGGEVPRDAVDAAVDAMFATYRVARMYADPPYWQDEIAGWQGRYGDKVVIKWATWRNRQVGFAFRGFATAIADGSLSHPGDRVFSQHIENAQRKPLTERDDSGKNLWSIQKETPDSAAKIDAAMAAVLAWEARIDAISTGALVLQPPSVYETRGITYL